MSNSEALYESFRVLGLIPIELKACVNTAKANDQVEALSKSFELFLSVDILHKASNGVTK